MPVVSPFVLNIGVAAYDLRKVVSVVPDSDNPDRVLVRFIDDNRVTVPFVRSVFEPAWEASLLASGGGGGGTYTNPDPVPVTIGGIEAGTTFAVPHTMKQMWDMLLYPNMGPQFSSFAIQGQPLTSLEVGAIIPASVTFTWTTTNPGLIQPNTISIFDVTSYPLVPLVSGLADVGSSGLVPMAGPIQLLAAGTYQFKIQGVDTASSLFSRTLTFSWMWSLFYGNNTSPTLTEAQILAMTGTLAGGYAGFYPVAAGGYKYICQSNELSAGAAQINKVYDPSTGFDIPMADSSDDPAYSNTDGGGFSYALVTVLNGSGISSPYRVYRTRNSLGSSLTLAVL